MSNILTNTNTQIYLNKLVAGFRDATAPMKEIFVFDASPAPAQRGDKVKVLTIPSGSSPTAWSAANGFTVQDSTRVGVDVELSNYYYNSAGVTVQEMNNSSLVNLESLGAIQQTELANTVFYDHLNYLSSSAEFASASLFASASSIGVDQLVDIRTHAVSTYLWSGPAYLIVNSKVFGNLLKDDGFQSHIRGGSDVAQGSNLFRSVRNVLGWTAIYEAPSIPFTHNVVGYAVTPRALASAMRYWAPHEGGTLATAFPITDPTTGITLGYRELVNQQYDRLEGYHTALWGKKVTNANAALMIKATVNA